MTEVWARCKQKEQTMFTFTPSCPCLAVTVHVGETAIMNIAKTELTAKTDLTANRAVLQSSGGTRSGTTSRKEETTATDVKTEVTRSTIDDGTST